MESMNEDGDERAVVNVRPVGSSPGGVTAGGALAEDEAAAGAPGEISTQPSSVRDTMVNPLHFRPCGLYYVQVPQTISLYYVQNVRWVSRARIFWEDRPPRTLSVNSWEAGGL